MGIGTSGPPQRSSRRNAAPRWGCSGQGIAWAGAFPRQGRAAGVWRVVEGDGGL